MDAERRVQREQERWWGTMFLNRLPMITESWGPVLMTYSWILLAPSGPWENTKQMQEGKREEGGCREGRGGEIGDRGEAGVLGQLWWDKTRGNKENCEGVEKMERASH